MVSSDSGPGGGGIISYYSAFALAFGMSLEQGSNFGLLIPSKMPYCVVFLGCGQKGQGEKFLGGFIF